MKTRHTRADWHNIQTSKGTKGAKVRITKTEEEEQHIPGSGWRYKPAQGRSKHGGRIGMKKQFKIK
jgi:hypothetical protein